MAFGKLPSGWALFLRWSIGNWCSPFSKLPMIWKQIAPFSALHFDSTRPGQKGIPPPRTCKRGMQTVSNSLLFQLRQRQKKWQPDQTKTHSATPPGIEPWVLRNLVARPNHWAKKPRQELRVNSRLSPSCQSIFVGAERELLTENDPDKSEFTMEYKHFWLVQLCVEFRARLFFTNYQNVTRLYTVHSSRKA